METAPDLSFCTTRDAASIVLDATRRHLETREAGFDRLDHKARFVATYGSAVALAVASHAPTGNTSLVLYVLAVAVSAAAAACGGIAAASRGVKRTTSPGTLFDERILLIEHGESAAKLYSLSLATSHFDASVAIASATKSKESPLKYAEVLAIFGTVLAALEFISIALRA